MLFIRPLPSRQRKKKPPPNTSLALISCLGRCNVHLQFLSSLQAVFFHALHTPSKLLVVPASPTIPSSKSTHFNAVEGSVMSHKSLSSWTLTAVSSLSTFFFSTTFSGSAARAVMLRARCSRL